jgi:transcription elongation factor Elf1
MQLNQKLGRCGIYCGQCRAYTEEVVNAAKQFKQWVEQDYSWLKDAEESFDYENFLKGMEWFINSKCPGCRESSEAWCEVKKCEKIQKNMVDNCLICEVFSECSHTEYQRKRYSYLFDHIEFIKKYGFNKYLDEEEKKAKEGIRIQDIREY